ncbi:uncharacterized protein LOC127075218 [Lathyrus oleraceus]|uniref:Uncharacterized protein n=1 Tax=Pisum sativum TaxID=3888 RepID=A0A9D5ASC1_PEA|nr:uncharacterized protein LOC127075218 [Pisum sativum]KAI5419903.1 hypothetical protein KIW84_043890 [Pisum sativum]
MATAVSNVAGRHSLSQILTDFVKFAVDSAIDGYIKIIPDRKHADKTVRKELINIPMLTPLKTKKHLDKKVANELLFETKVEGVKEEMNNIKQQYKTSNKLVEDSQPPNKMGDNGFKGINLIQENGKRVFIRSRL